MRDPIVEDVRRARAEHAARFGNDLNAICEDLRRLQDSCGHEVVRLAPKQLRSMDRREKSA